MSTDDAAAAAPDRHGRPASSPRRRRPVAAVAPRLLAIGLAAACLPSRSADAVAPAPARSTYVQLGVAEHDTVAVVAGCVLDWAWRRQLRYGTLGGYWDVGVGAWRTRGSAEASARWVAQIGVTPVLRWYPGDGGWFLEGAIGLHLLAPKYRSGDKRFSTTLNFGDHIAAGWRFGPGREREVALRYQHFSNGGLRHPNPGADFVQLRYAQRF
jgi:hypothetical protein